MLPLVVARYPVPQWDRPLAVTLSRETINPRPAQMAHIAALHLGAHKNIVGFSSYSEGCHDDVNKFVWSGVSWGSDRAHGISGGNDARAAASAAAHAHAHAGQGQPAPDVAAIVHDYAVAFFGAGDAEVGAAAAAADAFRAEPCWALLGLERCCLPLPTVSCTPRPPGAKQ